WADLPNLGMHRAGVDRALRDRFGGARVLFEIFGRVGSELGAAPCRAEIIGVTLMVVAMLGGVRVDRHAADRIDDTIGACLLAVMFVCLRHGLQPLPPGGI